MRHVSGLDRPWIQWTLIALAVVLTIATAAEAIALRRSRAAIEAARTSEMNARLEQQRLEIELRRERSARESLVARAPAPVPDVPPPALTLTPVVRHGATPPPPTVEVPPVDRAIELRLLLPRNAAASLHDFSIAVRTWSGGENVLSRRGVVRRLSTGERVVTALVTGDVFAVGAYEILLTAASAPGERGETATYEVAVGPAAR